MFIVTTETLMGNIVPLSARSCEQMGVLSGTLLLSEAKLLGAQTVAKRVQEFAAGRTCARKALSLLGIPRTAILRGSQNEPIWPIGIVGSITHCKGYCAAAVAPFAHCGGIGIDAEPNEGLPHGVLKLIARSAEQEWIFNASKSEICWDRLFFSIKESVYKIWYPLERCWLGFDQVEVEIDAEKCTFRATILRETSTCPPLVEGNFLAGDFLMTCASVPSLSSE